MRSTLVASAIGMAALLALACSSELKLVETKAEPAILQPGKKGKVFVVFSGAKGKVGSVQVTVREYPEYTLRLNDEGRMGDEKAGDGIWTYEFPVPYDAPARKFHLDVKVKDKEGNLLHFGEAEGPAATIEVEIR